MSRKMSETMRVLRKHFPPETGRCTRCLRKMYGYEGRRAKYPGEGLPLVDGTVSGRVCSDCAKEAP